MNNNELKLKLQRKASNSDSKFAEYDDYSSEKKKWQFVMSLLKKSNRTQDELEQTAAIVKSLRFLSQLPQDAIIEICRHCSYSKYPKQKVLIDTTPSMEENQTTALGLPMLPYQHFLIILTGSVSIMKLPSLLPSQLATANIKQDFSQGKIICQLGKGDSIGEEIIFRSFEKQPGRHIWLTREDTECLMLTMTQYRNLLKMTHESKLEFRKTYLQTLFVPLFTNYPEHILYELCKCVSHQIFPPNHLILTEGEESNGNMYFIVKGQLVVLKIVSVPPNKQTLKLLEIAKLSAREYFGELSLLMNQRRATSIMTTEASTLVECFVLHKSDFTRFLQKQSLEIMNQYAKTYPKETEIRTKYLEQQKWSQYKQDLLSEIGTKWQQK